MAKSNKTKSGAKSNSFRPKRNVKRVGAMAAVAKSARKKNA
jgi:hypothetical protein